MTPKRIRCAIYTRKSSEEGLEQGFNSLHAQREACEAYVLSQAGEGWQAIKTLYDDGGFSGGSMERPALQQLLGDIDRGLVDVVVVYKVDRLTRSLTDFARIVEAFDAKSVSFVSVTQAFNTTTSMGRLTLNVLLSFAQFEREVTGERIRDKIAASKQKGMWMGGVPPMGYSPPSDPLTRALVVDEAGAATVRLIFAKYLELGSVHATQAWLKEQGILSKAWVSAKGLQKGGLPIDRGALFHLLANRVYIGEIVHRGRCHPGAHAAIVERPIFEAVQAKLAAQAKRHRTRTTKVSTMPLKGLIFDADGEPMSPTFTHGSKGAIYRYYVSSPLQRGAKRKPGDETVRRVPAAPVEDVVASCLQRLAAHGDVPAKALMRVEVHSATIQLLVRRDALFKRRGDPQSELEVLRQRLRDDERIAEEASGGGTLRVTLPCRLRRTGGSISIIEGPTKKPKPALDPALIRALREAHQVLSGGEDAPLKAEGLNVGGAPSSFYHRKICRLAFLAPDIQRAILDGRQPSDLKLGRLLREPIPLAWADQRRLLGFGSA